jgi:hypothetical protein
MKALQDSIRNIHYTMDIKWHREFRHIETRVFYRVILPIIQKSGRNSF